MHSSLQAKTQPGIFSAQTSQLRFNDADYLAMICHEIGTPLTAIVGLSHILANIECSAQRKTECAEMLRDSSGMLMELMKNMLDSSRLEAGMFEIEKIEFDIIAMIQQAVNIIAMKVQEKGLELKVHIADDLPRHCVGDPLRIRQIVLNLLNNAVKFTEKGHIVLYVNPKRYSDGSDRISITVADTGIGMEDEMLGKIFDKYVQADPSISRKYGGAGLGLSISQNLACLMNGEITVKSWPQIGSHFIVTLPLKKTAILAYPHGKESEQLCCESSGV